LCGGEYLYFVHGTALVAPIASAAFDPLDEFGDIDPAVGDGELGVGFYTYALCAFDGAAGLEKAVEWARKVAGRHRRPYIVYARIRRIDFGMLTFEDYDLSKSQFYYRLYHPAFNAVGGQPSADVLRGYVLLHDGVTPKRGYPLQVKFGEKGAAALEIYAIKPVHEHGATR
jgi:hypothetical protein